MTDEFVQRSSDGIMQRISKERGGTISQMISEGRVQKIIQEYTEEQEAALRLFLIINPLYKDMVLDEVQRRSAFFREFHKVIPKAIPKPPMIMAFESVYHDAALGFL